MQRVANIEMPPVMVHITDRKQAGAQATERDFNATEASAWWGKSILDAKAMGHGSTTYQSAEVSVNGDKIICFLHTR